MFAARFRQLFSLGMGITTMTVAGCGSEDVTAPRVVTLLAVSGQGQEGLTGTTLSEPFAVRAEDQAGQPMAGLPVSWAVKSGGGSVSPAQSVTDNAGIATTVLQLGAAAGPQTVEATLPGGRPVTFTAQARAVGAPARLEVVSGADQTSPPGSALSAPLEVRVVDDLGNPVANVEVTWAPVGVLDGQVNPTRSMTDGNGLATTWWVLGATGGSKTVEARLGSLAPARFAAAASVTFSAVFTGSRHTCANDTGGVSYCWGFNGDGQLGLAAAAAGSGPVFAEPRPLATTGALTFGEISAGRHHTCAVTLSNIVYCWGANPDARTEVPDPSVFSAVSAGRTHTCGLGLTGLVTCWGSNLAGQLGSSDPEETEVTVFLFDPVASVSAGGLHTCAVTIWGDAWCWGFNRDGQVGTSWFDEYSLPWPVTGGLSFRAVTAGENHTCGLADDGTAWCWGRNSSGQLGDGSTVESAEPVAVLGGQTFVALSAGYAHSCGLTTTGEAWCWGRNRDGELGDGSTVDRPEPVRVGGGLRFSAISAGGGDAGISPAAPPAHTCGLTTAQALYCWGSNQFGALGDGSLTDRTLPAKVLYQP